MLTSMLVGRTLVYALASGSMLYERAASTDVSPLPGALPQQQLGRFSEPGDALAWEPQKRLPLHQQAFRPSQQQGQWQDLQLPGRQMPQPQHIQAQRGWQNYDLLSDSTRLRMENDALRQEIDQWRAVASRVAAREAWATQILQKAPSAPVGDVASQRLALLGTSSHTAAAHSVATATAKHVSQLKLATGVALSFELQLCVLTLGFCASLVIWFMALRGGLCGLCRVAKSQAETTAATKRRSKDVEPAICSPPKLMPGSALKGVLRRMGGEVTSHVEISEIHVGSMFSCRDVQVRITADRGQEHRTQVVRQADGSFIRFRETFVVEVRTSLLGGNDSPVTMEVLDASSVLADVRIPAVELQALATRPHREFHRTELAITTNLSKDDAGRKPYAAMRIRDVTGEATDCV